ncbi:MAG: TfoX/Sxy family protein [Candidatus Heimdallarchaeota archaeon]|nr:TfoX/Sxy family protein [Candidatus Heimdallarchaeota archaeon]MBY8993702.1 TfoX/Sxy family protein [Candidatus Heimdallarchaeota archaeon]
MTSKWGKPNKDLMDLLATLVEPYNCTSKKMFGTLTYFINNNMMTGVHEDIIFLRLSEEDREKIKTEFPSVVQFEPLEGRKMREYIVLDEEIYRDIPTLEKWLDKAVSFVSSLPPKIPKQKKK